MSLFKWGLIATGVPVRPSSKTERHRKAELAELAAQTEALREQARLVAEIARLSQRPLPPPTGLPQDAPAAPAPKRRGLRQAYNEGRYGA
jgi:hypothetical protein